LYGPIDRPALIASSDSTWRRYPLRTGDEAKIVKFELHEEWSIVSMRSFDAVNRFM